MNVHDSEHIAGVLEQSGYLESEDPLESDILIFNTCCVRKSAENRLWGALGRVADHEKRIIVAVTGCCASLYGMKILSDFPNVSLVFGRSEINELPQILSRASKQRILAVGDPSSGEIDFQHQRSCFPARAWVALSHGCSNYCTYCVVPLVRGPERCRPLGEVVEEVRRDMRDGKVKEVFLLGQNLNSYRDPGNNKIGFARALEEICSIDGVDRLKFLTSHPKDLTQDIIDAMADLPAVCSYLHLPLQAGSNPVLQSMNRMYGREHYLELVEEVRGKIGDITLTTDIMVGFPGESEEDFKMTMEMVEMIRFDGAYTFIYSGRPGTKAEKSLDLVPEEDKKRRFLFLAERQTEITYEKNRQLLGKWVEVLVEGVAKKGKGLLTGRNRGHRVVNFPGELSLVGSLAWVKIAKAGKNSLTGTMVEEKTGALAI